MKYRAGTLGLLLLWMTSAAQALGVVVIPLGDASQKLKNVITVAKSGGDFNSPVAALLSIPLAGTDAPAMDNPYLIVIAPGVYNVGSTQVIMREWVSMQGSGREVTKITGSVSAGNLGTDGALVVGASNAALSDLSIENAAKGDNAFGVFAYLASPRLERLKVSTHGAGIINVGVRIEEGAPLITDVETRGAGGISAIGLLIHKVDSALTNITAIGTDSTGSSQGVYMTFSSPVMENIIAKAFGGSTLGWDQALYISQSSPAISNLRATGGLGRETGWGVYAEFNSMPFIRNSTLSGTTDGLWLDNSTKGTRVVNTQILGGVNDGLPFATQCRETYDSALVSVAC